MSSQLYYDLKQNILNEFENVTTILKSCNLSNPEACKHPILIDAVSLLSMTDNDLKKLLKPHLNELTKDIIYTIALIDVNDKNNITASFLNAKKEKLENRAYSKLNTENTNTITDNVTLYVGSSKAKNILQRIRCHMGMGPKNTYAMHLNKWFPKSEKCKIKITLLEFSQPDKENLKTNLLELIEQALWNKMKPLLGKKSGLL